MLRPMTQDPDSALMIRYQQGDVRAFETLYRRHKGPVYRYFLRNGQDSRWAEELYQEVWIKLIRARDQYQPLAKFSTYLYQLAHNCLIDHIRKQSRRPQLVANEAHTPESVDHASTPDQALTQNQARDLLVRALSTLPDDQREAFVLREEVGLGLDDIAKVTGVGRETVKSRLRYANQKLRDSLRHAVGESS